MKDVFIQYLNLLFFLIPLGVIGIWRWSVWVVKKIIALFYKSPAIYNKNGTLAIITPVYNENVEIFKAALHSWQKNGNPDELIAVIDHTDKDCIRVFEEFASSNLNAKLIVTKKPGKRPALADGIRAAESEFVALVDSDTIWTNPIRKLILSPFFDAKVGGVSTRQDVYLPNTLAKRLFQIHLFNRYFVEMPFLAAAGDALTCISGRTAVYRKSAVIGLLDELTDEKFLGENVISGDDKTLTRLVQSEGWKVKYVMEALVHTPGFAGMLPFLKQFVRWNRNSWRSDIKTISSKWVWKRSKILGLHMLDRFVQPFTLLLGPVYFLVSLYFGYWQIALTVFLWWIISRSIKIYGHLKSHPKDLLIMPVYVFFTYIIAIIKLYSLLTLNRQGWITRWDNNRIKKFSMLGQLQAVVLITLLISGYFLLISARRYNSIQQANNFQTAYNQARLSAEVTSSEPKIFSDIELLAKKTAILNSKKGSAYGFYELKPGDTLLNLKQRLNLADIKSITYEDGVVIQNVNSIPVGRKIMIPVGDLQKPLRVEQFPLNRYMQRRPVISYDESLNTIYVRGGGSSVTLPEIKRALLYRKTVLEENAPGEWLLRSNLYIGKNVTLVVDKRDTKILKLKSDSSGHIWILSQGGNILFSDTKVMSWDEGKKSPDLEYEDGRSFVVAKSSGRMDVIGSEISHLGYEGLPRRGGPFGGSYGLSWKITNGSFKKNLLTGSVINSSIHDNYFGMYTFGATGLIIKNNKVFQNIQYGIDPHDDSNNFLISENEVFKNGNHGIIASKRCFSNEIIGNISYKNKLHGIMLDRDSNDNVIQNNTIYENVDGIALYNSNRNFISQNKIYGNRQGIRFNQESTLNYVESNDLIENLTGIHVYGESNKNVVVGNKVVGNNIGISIQNSSGNAFYASLRKAENKKDVFITTEKNSNEIK